MNSPTRSRSLVLDETPVGIGGFLLQRETKKKTVTFNHKNFRHLSICQFQPPALMQSELRVETSSMYRIPVIILVQSQSCSVHLHNRQSHIISHDLEDQKESVKHFYSLYVLTT